MRAASVEVAPESAPFGVDDGARRPRHRPCAGGPAPTPPNLNAVEDAISATRRAGGQMMLVCETGYRAGRPSVWGWALR
jgi:hypothetical protein